jgi:hypothetical protein
LVRHRAQEGDREIAVDEKLWARYLPESIRSLHGRPGLFGEVIEFRQAHQIGFARDTGVTIPTVEGIRLFCTATVTSPGPVQTCVLSCLSLTGLHGGRNILQFLLDLM